MERLVKDYGDLDPEEIKAALHRITRKFGGHKVKACFDAIETGALNEVASLLLGYYDGQYEHSLDTFKTRKPAIFASQTGNAAENAQGLVAKANEQGW